MIKDTSLQAYIGINEEGITGKQRRLIFSTISRHSGGLTRNEIHRLTKIPINAVCGRCKEMLKMGYIYDSGRRLDRHSGRENEVLAAFGSRGFYEK